MTHIQSIIRTNPFLQQINEEHHYETFTNASSESDNDSNDNDTNTNTNTNTITNPITNHITNTNTNPNPITNTNPNPINEFNIDNDDVDDIIIHLINKRKRNKTSRIINYNYNYNYNYKKNNNAIFRKVIFITIITLFIMIMLIYGVYDLYRVNEIIYGQIGFYAFYIYYIIHISWYSIFLIIHIFLILTQLCYSMNTDTYIKNIILNYNHIRYIIIVKILFSISIIIVICMNFLNYDINTVYNNDDVANISNIPLYYNLLYIETVLSFLCF